jgi:hypothetical protein
MTVDMNRRSFCTHQFEEVPRTNHRTEQAKVVGSCPTIGA